MSTSKEAAAIEQPTIATGEPPQTQLVVNDSEANVFYSSTSRVWGSAEEIMIDFSQGLRPTGKTNTAMLKIDSRVVLSPWAAKRLAIALGQTVQRYEQMYGTLEIDANKRHRSRGVLADGN